MRAAFLGHGLPLGASFWIPPFGRRRKITFTGPKEVSLSVELWFIRCSALIFASPCYFFFVPVVYDFACRRESAGILCGHAGAKSIIIEREDHFFIACEECGR